MTWRVDEYFAKAQAYWERASSRGRDSEDFLLNVCFTIEFVARGALCHIHPSLNAAPDTESLLYSCGEKPRTPPRTVDFVEVTKRLQRLLPTVTDSEVVSVRTLIDARNSELHGDKSEMSQLSPNALMPTVYSFVVKVTKFANQSIEVLLGKEDADLATQIAAATARDRSKRVSDLIRVCKERFFSLPKEDQERKRGASTTELLSVVLTNGNHIMYVKCPACAERGELLAAPVGRSAAFVRAEELFQEVRVVPIQFTCKCCELSIRGLDELMAAGFSHEYRSLDNVDPVDHFNIDPLDYVDREEVARQYSREEYEYQDE